MYVEPVYRVEWSPREEADTPTEDVLGYRAVSDDGRILGFGETHAEAIEAALQTTWGSVAA